MEYLAAVLALLAVVDLASAQSYANCQLCSNGCSAPVTGQPWCDTFGSWEANSSGVSSISSATLSTLSCPFYIDYTLVPYTYFTPGTSLTFKVGCGEIVVQGCNFSIAGVNIIADVSAITSLGPAGFSFNWAIFVQQYQSCGSYPWKGQLGNITVINNPNGWVASFLYLGGTIDFVLSVPSDTGAAALPSGILAVLAAMIA